MISSDGPVVERSLKECWNRTTTAQNVVSVLTSEVCYINAWLRSAPHRAPPPPAAGNKWRHAANCSGRAHKQRHFTVYYSHETLTLRMSPNATCGSTCGAHRCGATVVTRRLVRFTFAHRPCPAAAGYGAAGFCGCASPIS